MVDLGLDICIIVSVVDIDYLTAEVIYGTQRI
jgi:hypothetical protein